MKRFHFLIAVFLFGMTPALVHAKPETYMLDKDHTKVFFFVSHLGFSNFFGQFTKFDGTFILDEKKPENTVVDITVDTRSLSTGNETLDSELKGEPMFYVAKYPEVRFKSTNVRVIDKKKAQITGRMTIREVTAPVKMNVMLNKCGEHPMTGQYVCGFTIKGMMRRSDFGLTEWKGMVGDVVTLHMEVEGVSDRPAVKKKK